MPTTDTDDRSPVEPHLRKALSTSTEPEVRFHLRQALQYLTD